MRIEKIPISDINPAPYNPRKDLGPNDEEFKKLEQSIHRFGLVEPLVWNQRTGYLVGGHQRFKVLKERGDTTFQVVVVDLDTPDEKALNIALNKISGEWDFFALKELLIDLDDGDFNLSLTGYDEEELERMIQWEAPKERASMSDRALTAKCPQCNHEFIP